MEGPCNVPVQEDATALSPTITRMLEQAVAARAAYMEHAAQAIQLTKPKGGRKKVGCELLGS